MATRAGAIQRGFPLNDVIVQALERYHHYYGDSCQVEEYPTGSGVRMKLQQVATELARVAHCLEALAKGCSARERAA